MQIDTTISIVAIVSGLVGSLLTGWVSYVVRLKVREREVANRQKRLAHVYFLQLTDVVATDVIFRETTDRLNAEYGTKEKSHALSHAVAVALAEGLSKLNPEEIKDIFSLLVPFFEVMREWVDRTLLTPAQLAELPQETVYFYNHYMSKAQGLKAYIRLIESCLDSGHARLLSPEIIHGFMSTYGEISDACGELRGAFIRHGEISEAEAQVALDRSYKMWKEHLARSFSQSSKLKAARKILKESLEANRPSGGIDGSGG